MSDVNLSSASIDEDVRRRFEAAWLAGRPEPIEKFLPSPEDPKYLATLEELVHIELEFSWKKRLPPAQPEAIPPKLPPPQARLPRVEDYLRRFAELNRPAVVLRLVEQECFVRRQAGQQVLVAEYRRRFPELVPAGGRFEALLGTVGLGRPEFSSVDAGATGRPAGAGTQAPLPRTFGSYELLEEIGRGGMGVVYRAHQRIADRIVALKVVRRDLIATLAPDTQTSAVDRFRHEAQAAARLDHESIVTVYEVGEVDGEPFFSMRFVEGPSLSDLLRDGPLANRRAARYIESVARAVDQAHAHGILHRDLKPKNILIDAAADRAMVADFGLAKLLENQDELTQSGEVMGSPPYMSPEQAMDSSRVTTRTDVYAAGATLYHVLTGRAPFHAATVLETLQQVTDREPAPPRQLNPAIDRDLETICLKCLEKEPSERYASAGALADDLGRYLAGEPIEARPIGRLQRTYRWCRRNPVVAALIASTASFLLLALLAAVVGYVQTSSALEEVEAGYRQQRQTVDDFFTRVSEDTLLNQPGMQPLRRELLQQALDYYQRFLEQRRDGAAIEDELAMTHFRVGRIVEQMEAPQDALLSYRRAAEMQRRLLAETPDDGQRLEALGDTLTAMGGALFRQGSLDEARRAHQETVTIRAEVAAAASDPGPPKRKLANSYMNLALVDQKLGRTAEARSGFEKSQAIRREVLALDPASAETRRDLAMGCYNLGVLALALAPPDYDAAQANLDESAAIFEELLDANPDDLANQYRLAISCRLLADVHGVRQEWEAAGELYQRALGRMERLAQSNPSVPEYQASLAGLLMNLGVLESAQGGTAATESLDRAAAILTKLVGEYAAVARYRRDLAVTLREIAACRSSAGEHEEARTALEAAQTHLAALAEAFPENDEYKALLSETAADSQEK